MVHPGRGCGRISSTAACQLPLISGTLALMSMSSRPPLIAPRIAAAPPIELRARGDFVEWLAGTGGSLAVTTYNSGKLALLSVPAGELIASYWSFPRPMGLAFAEGRLALATRDHFWQFEIEAAESAPSTDPIVVTPQLIHANVIGQFVADHRANGSEASH